MAGLHSWSYSWAPFSLAAIETFWLLLFQEEVDAGAIIFQEAVPVKIGDTVETLSERVKEAEHRAFPAALQLVASGAVQMGEAGRICWK